MLDIDIFPFKNRPAKQLPKGVLKDVAQSPFIVQSVCPFFSPENNSS